MSTSGNPPAPKYIPDRDLAWDLFEIRFASQVLRNVKHYKKDKKLTARQISERLADAGWPLSVSSINGMLGAKGRHSISLTELLALARALEVAPIELVFPITYGDSVEIAISDVVHPYEAYRYFNGYGSSTEEIFDKSGYRHARLGGVGAMGGVIKLFDRHEELLQRLRNDHAFWFGDHAVRVAMKSPRSDTERDLDAFAEREAPLVTQLSDVRHRIRSLGAVPPPIPVALDFVDDDAAPLPRFPIDGIAGESSINETAGYLLRKHYG